MKASLRQLWKHKATEDHFFSSQGYEGALRTHAEICIRCWLSRLLNLRSPGDLGTQERLEYQKALLDRRIRCPYIRLQNRKKFGFSPLPFDKANPKPKTPLIPWGRNRTNPPQGCIRTFEHSMVPKIRT